MTRLSVTEADVCDHFDGEMIEVSNFPSGTQRIPGWRCLHCGWRIGSIELPLAHNCPEEGIEQERRRKAKS